MRHRAGLFSIILASCLVCAFCSGSGGPSAPGPAATPGPTLDVSGYWTATAFPPECVSTFLIQFGQNGSSFDGATVSNTGSADITIEMQGTIAGNTVHGSFSERLETSSGSACGVKGDFQGQVLSSNDIRVSMPTTVGEPRPCCIGPVTISLSR